MNCQAVEAVLTHSHAANAARMVLVAIAARTDESGKVSDLPIPELMAAANASERAVKYAIEELRDVLGELKTTGGRGRGQHFSFDISPLLNKVQNPSDKGADSAPIQVKEENSAPNSALKGANIDSIDAKSAPLSDAKGANNAGTDVANILPKTDQEKLKDTKSHSEAGASAVPPVQDVFEYWQAKAGHPKAKLTTKRERVIRNRLKEGYTPEELKRVVDGCLASPFHMGHNDRQMRYDGIQTIYRDGEQVEKFIALADTSGSRPQNGTAPKPELTAEDIEQVTRTVVDRLGDGETIEAIERQIAPSLRAYDWQRVRAIALSQVGPDKQPKPKPVSATAAVVTDIASRMRMSHG